MDPYRVRRSSFTPPFSNATQEPLIVVEESGPGEEEEQASSSRSSPRQSLDIDSPVNPYLLHPWRDPRETRKHSLPTAQVTQGITASQVRRLSEQGGEGSGPTPREAAFLATLCQAPSPSRGGRRHSVVTISKVPNTIFARNRRESIAAVPSSISNSSRTPSVANSGSRRESLTGPPSTDVRGSIHNLQLDIMDDIVQARKARMKLWNTSNEKVCEVHTLDENDAKQSSPMRYTNRRYSDFVGAPLPTIPSHRRASEMPLPASPCTTTSTSTNSTIPGSSAMASFGRKLKAGIVCTNTDLLGLLSTLTSSATEINEYEDIPTPTTKLITSENLLSTTTAAAAGPSRPRSASVSPMVSSRSPFPSTTPTSASGRSPSICVIPKVVVPKDSPERRRRKSSATKTSRSNSFDGSVLNNAKQLFTAADEKTAMLSGWFAKRHQPMATKKSAPKSNQSAAIAFSKEVLDRFKDKDKKESAGPTGRDSAKAGGSSGGGSSNSSNKLKWDHKSPVVDANVIGNAIEGFLRKSSTTSSKGPTPKETSRLRKAEKSGGSNAASNGAGSSSRSIWFGKGDEDDSKDTCDSSLCSTLKDLFVK